MPKSRRSQRSQRSRKSKKTYLPKPTRGKMAPYTTFESEAARHKHLNALVKKHGYASTVRDLNLRAIDNKNTNPGVSAKMRKDITYLQHKYRPVHKSKKSRRSRRSKR